MGNEGKWRIKRISRREGGPSREKSQLSCSECELHVLGGWMLGEAAAKQMQVQSCMPGVCLTVPGWGGGARAG